MFFPMRKQDRFMINLVPMVFSNQEMHLTMVMLPISMISSNPSLVIMVMVLEDVKHVQKIWFSVSH